MGRAMMAAVVGTPGVRACCGRVVVNQHDVQEGSDGCTADQAALVAVVQECQAQMIYIARRYVHDQEIAQEVVQETWLAAWRGLAVFAGRASLKSWIFAILLNRARTRGKQEARRQALAVDEVTLNPEETEQRMDESARSPEVYLLQQEIYAYLGQAIAALPQQQRQVITLSDLEARSPAEICSLLNVSEGNQRVLLHRARRRVRHALLAYWQDDS